MSNDKLKPEQVRAELTRINGRYNGVYEMLNAISNENDALKLYGLDALEHLARLSIENREKEKIIDITRGAFNNVLVSAEQGELEKITQEQWHKYVEIAQGNVDLPPDQEPVIIDNKE